MVKEFEDFCKRVAEFICVESPFEEGVVTLSELDEKDFAAIDLTHVEDAIDISINKELRDIKIFDEVEYGYAF